MGYKGGEKDKAKGQKQQAAQKANDLKVPG